MYWAHVCYCHLRLAVSGRCCDYCSLGVAADHETSFCLSSHPFFGIVLPNQSRPPAADPEEQAGVESQVPPRKKVRQERAEDTAQANSSTASGRRGDTTAETKPSSSAHSVPRSLAHLVDYFPDLNGPNRLTRSATKNQRTRASYVQGESARHLPNKSEQAVVVDPEEPQGKSMESRAQGGHKMGKKGKTQAKTSARPPQPQSPNNDFFLTGTSDGSSVSVNRTASQTYGSFFSTFGPRVQNLLMRCPVSSSAVVPATDRVNTLLANLQKQDDSSTQLQALIELCNLLAMSSDESLGPSFPYKEVVRVLTRMLQADHNFDITAHVCRALSNLVELVPRICSSLLDAVPHLLAKLKRVECIDVAEAALSALELLSRRHSKAILSANGIHACLLYIEFFPLASQRSALQIVANCCYYLMPAEFDYLNEALPALTQRLRSQDKKTVELMCIAFSRLVENFVASPESIARLCEAGLLENVRLMLVTSPQVISSAMLANVLRMLHLICCNCNQIVVQLVRTGIASTLHFLLTGGSPDVFPEHRELVSRSPQELYELVLLIGELLPPLQLTGLFEIDTWLQPNLTSSQHAAWYWKQDKDNWRPFLPLDNRSLEVAYQMHEDEVALSIMGQTFLVDLSAMAMTPDDDSDITIQVERRSKEGADVQGSSPPARRSTANKSKGQSSSKSGEAKAKISHPSTSSRSSTSDPRIDLLKAEPALYDEIITSLFPLLYEVYTSMGGPAVRQECLRCFLKMIYHGKIELVTRLLENVPVSTLIAGMLTSQDIKFIVCALQLTKLLLEKKKELFTMCFQREGVVYQMKHLSDHLKKINATTVFPASEIDMLTLQGSRQLAIMNANNALDQSFMVQGNKVALRHCTHHHHHHHHRYVQVSNAARALSLSIPLLNHTAAMVARRTNANGNSSAPSSNTTTMTLRLPRPSGSVSSSVDAVVIDRPMPAAPTTTTTTTGTTSTLPTHGKGHGRGRTRKNADAGQSRESNGRSRSPLRRSAPARSDLFNQAFSGWTGRSVVTFPGQTLESAPAASGHSAASYDANRRNYWKMANEKVTDWAIQLSKEILDGYFNEQNSCTGTELPTVDRLSEAAKKLKCCDYVGLTELASLLMSDVTCFELLQSGIVDHLTNYLTNCVWDELAERLRRFCRILFNVSVIKDVDSDCVPLVEVPPSEAGKNLVTKLVLCINQLEQFPVKIHEVSLGHNNNSSGSLRGINALRFLHEQLIRCLPIRHPQETGLNEWKRGSFRVDPLTHVSAIEKYLIAKGVGRPGAGEESTDDEDDDGESAEDESDAITNSIGAVGQHKLQLVINGTVLPYDMSIYQAVRQYGSTFESAHSENNGTMTDRSDIWVNVHRIFYRSVPQGETVVSNTSRQSAAVAPNASTAGPRSKRANRGAAKKRLQPTAAVYEAPVNPLQQFLTGSAFALSGSDPSLKCLTLLRIIFSISRHWSVLYEGEALITTSAPLLPLSTFHVSKIAAKIHRQMQDPMVVITNHIPDWVEQIAPFVLPFDARIALFGTIALDQDRALQRILENSADSSISASSSSERLTPRIERRKVCITRNNILKQAETVLNNMNQSRAVLEIQYENEVGSGLGPTLEFYALVSYNLQRADLKLWHGTVVKSQLSEGVTEYIQNSTGLYPAVRDFNSEHQADKTLSLFKLFGKLLARVLLDGRTVDLPLNPLFFKWFLQAENTLRLTDLHDLDAALGRSVDYLQRLVFKSKVSDEKRKQAEAEVEALSIDFTVPGYPDIQMKPNGKNILVNIDNLTEYLELMSHWLLRAGVVRQMEAARASFSSIIQLRSLKMFYPEEMDQLFCGCRTSTDIWDAHVLQQAIHPDHGYTHDSPQIRWLVDLMASYNETERRDFLQFMTGSPRLPVGGLKNLNPPFTVVRKHCDDGNVDSQLPSVMTCVNYLKLPEYTTPEALSERLPQLNANNSSPESANSTTAKRASSEFPLLYYCGCAQIANPKNENAIASIINQLCSEATFTVSSVAVPKTLQESVRLFDEQSCLVGSFPISRIVFCKKSVCPDRCFLAFTFIASSDENVGDPCYQCHVLSSPDQSTVDNVMSDFAYVFAQKDTAASKSDPSDSCVSTSCTPLSFTFEAQLNIKEKDDKGNLCSSPQEKCCFKLRRSREKLVTFIVSQLGGPRSLVVEKCFGLLLAAGRNVKSADMQLLDVAKTRVFMTVATDVLFADVPEPLRFSVCCRVRIFDENERFWNLKGKPVTERYHLEIQQLETANDDAPSGFSVVRFDADDHSVSTVRRSSKGILVNLVAPPDENESDSDEPLLSGSGEVSSECSDLVRANWHECLSKWSENLEKRPKEMVSLIRNGIPDRLRGDVWQLLAGCHEVPQLSKSYYSLLEKAYAVYDAEVGYCQGLSFLAASLLLHMPEERAFTVLVRIMYHYGLRDLFKQGFETLHLRFFQLDRLMRHYLPTLSAHFDSLHIETHMFASQWFLTLFTAKFPLSMVFHIIDLFLSEASEQDLLSQDFEGALKYFRVALPRKYRTEAMAKELIQCAVQFRISHKKIAKYEEEFIEMKRQEAESQNPLERYQRENLKLKEEILRLQRENDDLACELVTSKVHLRNDLDAVAFVLIVDAFFAEENIESLTSQLERTGRLCKDLQEENRNLLHESEHVKETCRRELLKQEADNKRDRIIIDDYKQMCAELSAKLELLQKRYEEERKRFMDIAEECENCSPRIEECQQAPEEEELASNVEAGDFGSSHCFTDQIDQINRLELELAQAKLQLVECECRNQDLMHQLNQCHACHEQKSTWISKTINSIKEAARNPAVPNLKKDMEVESIRLKEEGNKYFSEGDLEKSLEYYNRALEHCQKDQCAIRATLFKNLAAVYLKRQDYAAAERNATCSLELVPNDPKALFRRAQAREQLNKFGDALQDAKVALHYDSNNKAVVSFMQQLRRNIEKKHSELSSIDTQVRIMMDYLDDSDHVEKRLQAVNNLISLSLQPQGVNQIFSVQGHKKIIDILREETNADLLLAANRCLANLVTNEQNLSKLLDSIGMRSVVGLMDNSDDRVTKAAIFLLQRCFNVLMRDCANDDAKVDEELVERNKLLLVDLIFELKRLLTDRSVGAEARNGSITLLSKNLIHLNNGLPRGWSWKFVENDGLERLLDVSCSSPQLMTLPVDANTRDNVALCLARLYDDMLFDNWRSLYKERVTNYVQKKMQSLNEEGKIELCSMVTTLLRGPLDVGFAIASTPEFTNLISEMACSSNPLCQSFAADAIVHTVSKRDRCDVFLANGVSVLRRLFNSPEESVKGLCKCASSGGGDISLRPTEEEKMCALAQMCKSFMAKNTSLDTRCLAAEGLAYLTLDADVKEWLINDVKLIRSLVSLAVIFQCRIQEAGPLCVFGVSSIFVNLTNTYDQRKVEPELVQLARFAKHHVPEEHPKDGEEFVKNRVRILVKEGGVSACIAMSNTESEASRESLSRVLHGFCMEPEHRGYVVQDGGAKLLLKLVTSNSPVGKGIAAQALAKICIVIDPAIALPGQRCHEIVRPLISLLHPDKSGLENYEALLALTNLAASDDSIRMTMVNADVLPAMEHFWFMQDHEQLRAAAAELFLNLLHCPQVFKKVSTGGNDRLKLWVLYCNEEDERLVLSSVAAVALLTDDAKVPSWVTIFKEACMHVNKEVQRRSLLCLLNMMNSCYDVAAKIVQSELFEVLVAISKLQDSNRAECLQLARECLKVAEHKKLILPTDRELYERDTGKSTVHLDERGEQEECVPTSWRTRILPFGHGLVLIKYLQQ
ncbi:hypothetical protein M513_03271 [Trichuris suis]|uniref:E3 ubiquitin-protein ligase n=1 Tax=Trichuris suis TaxID=68888 RepID=A0A085MF36_9BILA|nr:hypothetical protein M513_03271 [Trichuris suis]